MDSLSKHWRNHIVSVAEKKLGRELTEAEQAFLSPREGYLALEAIEDTVNNTTGVELEKYLKLEDNQ